MLVSYVYTDGRTKPPRGYVVTTSPEAVKALLADCAPIEVVEGHDLVGLAAPEPELEVVSPVAPMIVPPIADDRDGWPNGYTFTRHGAYLAVFAPDGEAVKSDAPSGKFRGENAAQEAAWNHKGGQE